MLWSFVPTYAIAVDLGQAHDYTAIAILERTAVAGERLDGAPAEPAGRYDVLHLERQPLGTSYTALPPRLDTLLAMTRHRWAQRAQPHSPRVLYPHEAPVALVIDYTGVGRPVLDLLTQAGLDPVAVTITGGDQVIRVGRRELRVPKRNLVGAVQVLLQARRLRWPATLPEAATLAAELANFKAKITLAGHDSYGAGDDWREGNHDDLVLSVALGCWHGEHEAAEQAARTVHVSSYLTSGDDDDENERRFW